MKTWDVVNGFGWIILILCVLYRLAVRVERWWLAAVDRRERLEELERSVRFHRDTLFDLRRDLLESREEIAKWRQIVVERLR